MCKDGEQEEWWPSVPRAVNMTVVCISAKEENKLDEGGELGVMNEPVRRR